jgi:hypothetical protein
MEKCMPDQPALAQRVFSSFAQLSTVAADLNAVSDDLGKSVADIDAALKKLNIGISVWVKVRTWDGDDSRGDLSFWSEDLGFAKINGKWGISLRRVEGDYNHPEDESVEEWLFGDAPRALRFQAIDKLPELIEKLNMEAAKTITAIQGKLPEVQTVAAALARAAGSASSDRKLNAFGGLDPEGESGWVKAARDAGREPFGPLTKGAK